MQALLAQARELFAKDEEKLIELKEKLANRKMPEKRQLLNTENLTPEQRQAAEAARDDQQEADRLNEAQAILDGIKTNQLVRKMHLLLSLFTLHLKITLSWL